MTKLSPAEYDNIKASLQAELPKGACVFVVKIRTTYANEVVTLYAIHDNVPVWLTGQAAKIMHYPMTGRHMMVHKPGYSVGQFLTEYLGMLLYADKDAFIYSEL